MKRISIFGASSDRIPENYKKEAFIMGQLIADQGWCQYNGGGNLGIMGSATRGALQNNGEVHGIIIEVYKEFQAEGLTSCVTFDTFHERKQGLIDVADAVVVMPGGVGTLSELFHYIDDLLAAIHKGNKEPPLILVNVDGFFSGILEWIKSKVVGEHFLKEELWASVILEVKDAECAINKLKQLLY
ncbi:MAG: TIGR00730 family Rossman fold protein [Planctomycetota bacterium]|nr:MAG: TIGR00730 family Rossman fold protein [Planctomycetota bacterium]